MPCGRHAASRQMTVALCLGLAVTVGTTARARADRIVLRNLDIISDRTVTGFDEDGVRLDDGRIVAWDQIEMARVSEPQQAALDLMLQELGGHLYRIRQRLAVGDYVGLLPHAEAVQHRYVGRRSETAYMVFQSLMWGRMAEGKREEAVTPYLHCLDYLTSIPAGRPAELPGTRRLRFDPQTGYSPELVPVWFDEQGAGRAWAELSEAWQRLQTPPRPAAHVYRATVALAAGERATAEQVVAELADQPRWQALVRVPLQLATGQPELALQTLSENDGAVADDLRPVLLYWSGRARMAQTGADVRQEGLLTLLRLAALHGSEQPELAAAALEIVRQALADQGDAKGSIAVRRELLDRYGHTWHARRLRAESTDAR